MVKISLIKPLDQPLGNRRLLTELKLALDDAAFNELFIIVAYAKSGPLLRLKSRLERWHNSGKTAHIILGIDQQGTSIEALELSLELFDSIYITQNVGITFHPKIYLFKGTEQARSFVGSNNLTVGGTEKNFETSVHIEMGLPDDKSVLAEITASWNELLPENCAATFKLDRKGLLKLKKQNLVLPEKFLYSKMKAGDSASVSASAWGKKSKINIKPESPLPKEILLGRKKTKTVKTKTHNSPDTKPVVPKQKIENTTVVARGLVMQIKPHHNGEIFLSVIAAKQYPDFFDWPFTGATTPKKPGNPTYPQMTPDPIVDIEVFGEKSKPLMSLAKYRLNTVYYEKNSEIRITASPLVDVVPEFSVLIIELSPVEGIKYKMTIHRPDSPDYDLWVSACNQTMPSGGKPIARKFGWF